MARVNHKLVKQRLNEKRSKITDRQFFTSRLFAGHLEDLAAAQTRRYHYNRRANLKEEMKNGCLTDWMQKDNYQFDTDEDSYEGWIDGEHSSSHYRVSITKLPLQLPNSVYGTLGREFIDLCRVEDFIEQIESWDNVGMLTDEQYQELISDKTIPDRIHKALGMNDGYYESYWESVSEVAHTVVNAYIDQNTHIGAESSEKKNEEV